MSLLVGLRVSSRSPPMDRTTRPMPRLVRSASMDNSLAVLRASRSGLVTASTSPSRRKARHSVSFVRCATLDACSLNTFSAPAAFRSRCCAAKPAVWSQVDVRAYPTIIARRLFVLLAFETSCGMASEKYRDISFGRDFRGFAAIAICPL